MDILLRQRITSEMKKRIYHSVYFLDYRKPIPKDNSDYRQFNGYKLIEEVDPDLFYTNAYMYFEESYSEKIFYHTVKFDIPHEYFEYVCESGPGRSTMNLTACQMYKGADGVIDNGLVRYNDIKIEFNLNKK